MDASFITKGPIKMPLHKSTSAYKHPFYLLFCGILLAFIFHGIQTPGLAKAAPGVQHPAGIVVTCFDGDTIKLKDRRVVRLAGIDAPEVPHRDRKGQFYARDAKMIIQKLVQGKPVNLEFPGLNAKDKYGRLIAEVFLEDGKSLNEILVQNGAAFFYPHEDLDPDFQEKLRVLQEEAIHERRGLWKDLLDTPLAEYAYLGNRQSKRFFPGNCVETANILPRNRVHFGNLMDAFIAGYAPARICVFWPEEK